jgi:hypothetical protein
MRLSGVVAFVVKTIAKINWNNPRSLSPSNKEELASLLAKDYYVIVTHSRSHLATYFINLSDWFLTHKWGFWNHCLMNLEDDVTVEKDFRLIEATIFRGTVFDTFDTVFKDVDAVALLRPKSMTLEKWTAVLDRAKNNEGKKYDTLYDFAQDKKLSCIELVRNILQAEPNYEEDFANFEATLLKYKELTPQMLYDCQDFVAVLEIRIR